MSPALILACVGGYFAFLLAIAWYTSRKATNASYFLGNKASPWYAVAFGLISDSLSGVTFISVPGKVAADKFSYLQIVFGYVLGYIVIAEILLPLYYRLNLRSEEHTSELQSQSNLVCRLLLEKKNTNRISTNL